MKFGFRTPSFKKSFAARTSFKRVIRHSLGIKAPKGLGIFTNPKKAIYNKVYNRTTVSIFPLPKGKRNKVSSRSNSKNKKNSNDELISILDSIDISNTKTNNSSSTGCLKVFLIIWIAIALIGWLSSYM